MTVHPDKNVGRVLFVVEGNRTEFALLKTIFHHILGYRYLSKPRNKMEWYIQEKNSSNQIAVINTKESAIKDISADDYLDSIFEELIHEHQFPVDKSAIYYLFDRDNKSNTDVQGIEAYIEQLKNPYENEDFKAGQLLLSYPSIESYQLSHVQENCGELSFGLGSEVKTYLGEPKQHRMRMGAMNQTTLLHATQEFVLFLDAQKTDWDIDTFAPSAPSSRKVFENQEAFYEQYHTVRLFSMLTLAFLQLGIITLD